MILPCILYKAGIASVVLVVLALPTTATKINLKRERKTDYGTKEHRVLMPTPSNMHTPRSEVLPPYLLPAGRTKGKTPDRHKNRMIDDQASTRDHALKGQSSASASTPSSRPPSRSLATRRRTPHDAADFDARLAALEVVQPFTVAPRESRIGAIVYAVNHASKWIEGGSWEDLGGPWKDLEGSWKYLEKHQYEPLYLTPRIKGKVSDRVLSINHLEGPNGLHGLEPADVMEALKHSPGWVPHINKYTEVATGTDQFAEVRNPPTTRVALYSSAMCAESIANYQAPRHEYRAIKEKADIGSKVPPRCAVIYVVCKGKVHQAVMIPANMAKDNAQGLWDA